MLCAFKSGVFLFFAGFVVCMTVFVVLCIPETRGVSVEDIDQLVMSHWLWRRIVGNSSGNRVSGGACCCPDLDVSDVVEKAT